MARDGDPKKPDATKVLFGKKEPPEPPAAMVRRGVGLTINGTSTTQKLTPEGGAYLSELARSKARDASEKAALASVPRAPPRAKRHEPTIKRNLTPSHDKMSGKHKADDFER